MSRHLLRQVFFLNEEQEKTEVLFIGDSPNDWPMFQAFPISVGVANVLDFKGQLDPDPAWITEKRGGYGFSEMAKFLISQQNICIYRIFESIILISHSYSKLKLCCWSPRKI